VTRGFAISLVLVLGLSGCGSSSAGGRSSKTKAALTVEHVLDRSTGILYIEGSIWHLRLVASEGAVMVDQKLADETVALELVPGRYRLESEELPCDGNCGTLDPGRDGCSTEFEVQPRTTLAATVTLRPTQGCAIEFSPEPAA
jgi:hypothetical protein